MSISRSKSIAVLTLAAASLLRAGDLRASPEFLRPDPFGGIVKPDRTTPPQPMLNAVRVDAARNSYVSVHLVATPEAGADYSVTLSLPLPCDLYREWYHRNASDGQFYPDALIPVKADRWKSRLPEADNRVPGQTAQAFWLDIWVSADATPGLKKGSATLTSGRSVATLPIEINVLALSVPNEDPVTLDSNSYGTSWMFGQYPTTLPRQDDKRLYDLIHAYHRVFYEHRSTFHQLGYGHGGKVGPEFAPELTGSGRNKHISSWTRFDAHYGALLDGSAFGNTRRGARPIPWVYLPINPEWPASYLWWGEPGYRAEFVNVVSEMERHFREKGWTSTRFEMFFNHKKRYKAFGWDGDEIRFPDDNNRIVEFRRLLGEALPKDTPVHFVVRADTSWSMADQFERLRNVVNFWVAGEGILLWQPADTVAKLRARGDTVWTYGGTPPVDRAAVDITLHPLRTWINGAQGFVRWQTVDPGPDPWFSLSGGGETLVYPGDRFGIGEPLPSIRLKLQRNVLQDIALLDLLATSGERRTVATEVSRRYNGLRPEDWRTTAPALAATSPLDWNNNDIEDALRPWEARFQNLKPDAWSGIRAFALSAGGRR